MLIPLGAELAFEWPATASSWTSAMLRAEMWQLRTLLPYEARFDGCRFQLEDASRQAVLKPWRVVSNASRFQQHLNQHCEHRHQHVPCSGTLAEKSAYYTPMLVKLLGELIVLPRDLAALLEEVEADLAQLPNPGASSSKALALPAPATELAGNRDDTDITLESSVDVYPEDVPAPRVLVSPVAPSPEERDRHNLMHVPFQPWCGLCQRGKARDLPHRKLGEDATAGTPVAQFDYAFLRMRLAADEEQGQPESQNPLITVLVGVHVASGMGFAVQAKWQGKADRHAITATLRWLRETGCTGSLRIRTDPGSSIVSTAEALAAARVAPTALETGAAKGHGSMGSVERFIQALATQTRTLLLALEERFSCRVPSSSPWPPRLVAHSAWVLSRFQSHRPDSRTSYERGYRKRWQGQLAEIGQQVWPRDPRATEGLAKLAPRFWQGCWLGKALASNEQIFASTVGGMTVRTIKPVAVQDQKPEVFEAMLFFSWQPLPEMAVPFPSPATGGF